MPDRTPPPLWSAPPNARQALLAGEPPLFFGATIGTTQKDDTRWQAFWTREGIVGRSQTGRVFPSDGQAFLDELPFVYKTIYLMAVPRRDEALS